MVNSFDHVHLYAADPEATITFYVEVLGAERLGVIPSSSGGGNHFLILGGQYLVISAFHLTSRQPSRPRSAMARAAPASASRIWGSMSTTWMR